MLGGGTEPLPGGRPPRGCWPATRTPRPASRTACSTCSARCAGPGRWSWPACRSVTRRRAPWPPGCRHSVLANVRSARLVDELDADGATPVVRSRDPRVLERWLPALLAGAADPRARAFLRAAARLHAAIGAAGAGGGGRAAASLRAGLLTLVDGDDRWPWWGTGDAGDAHGDGRAAGRPDRARAGLAGAERAQSRRSTVTSGAVERRGPPGAQPDLALGAHPALGRLPVHRGGVAPGTRRPGRSSPGASRSAARRSGTAPTAAPCRRPR